MSDKEPSDWMKLLVVLLFTEVGWISMGIMAMLAYLVIHGVPQ